jgi:hypothetical protein
MFQLIERPVGSEDLTTSDIIAGLALILSAASLFLSFLTHREAASLKVAEKKTQILSSLTWSLMEATHLQSMVRSVLKERSKLQSLPDGFELIEPGLSQIIETAKGGIAWARTSSIDDPIEIERRRSSAVAAETQIKKVSEMIKEIPIRTISP